MHKHMHIHTRTHKHKHRGREILELIQRDKTYMRSIKNSLSHTHMQTHTHIHTHAHTCTHSVHVCMYVCMYVPKTPQKAINYKRTKIYLKIYKIWFQDSLYTLFNVQYLT